MMDAVIGLGANLGERGRVLAAAVAELGRLGVVTAVSRLYETPPVGPPQPSYLNAAARLETTLEPAALLQALLDVEKRHGRERREKWGPRTLDLDILWIRDRVVDEPALTVPHLRLRERLFALLPLLDVAPDALDPRSSEPLLHWARALASDPAIRVVAERDWARDGALREPAYERR